MKNIILCLALAGVIGGCALGPSAQDSAGDNEFSDFDKGAEVAASNSGSESLPPATDESLNNELESQTDQNQQTAQATDPNQGAVDEFAQFEKEEPPAVQPEPVQPVENQAQQPPPPVVEEPKPIQPPPVTPPPPPSRPVTIQRLQYKGNDVGGTLAIEADGPMTYKTRVNPNTRQFILEVPNSKLSFKAKRPLITKDFPGGIGSIDPYQAPGSNTSRIVFQMREGAQEPIVEADGHALLVVSGPPASKVQVPPMVIEKVEPKVPKIEAKDPLESKEAKAEKNKVIEIDDKGGLGEEETPVDQKVSQSKILSSGSLQEFMSGNQQFYGKKISFEANDVDLRDLFKFISDESGVNLFISEEVKGKISVRFKQVPWDQVLVVIMQAKKLGYVRQGQILRIATLADIKAEEQSFTEAKEAKLSVLPLQVKMIPISYAKPDEIMKNVSPFLTKRGKMIAEPRTSAIVLSDVDEAIERIQKLIAALDTPPPQVLIEGKIVEATDTFQRFIGLNWSTGGDPIDIGTNTKGNTMQATVGLNNGISGGNNLNLNITQLDFLGNLTAALGLGESTGELRVLSSPRILTLHNEQAIITQQTEIPLISAVTSPTGGVTNQVSFKQVKLTLDVTPQVTNDASVLLKVNMNRDFPGPIADEKSGARPINSRSATTKVVVRNGQTAVIGGIYQSDSTESEKRFPGLASIPVLGWLFKNNNMDRQKNELLIFLTPRIVGQADSGISSSPIGPSTSPATPPESAPSAPVEGGELQL